MNILIGLALGALMIAIQQWEYACFKIFESRLKKIEELIEKGKSK